MTLRTIVVSLFLFACGQVQANNDSNNKIKKKPHILMIVMDDLGSHDLGIHGTGIQTPHSDRLATEGMYLENYYVQPYCSPTRASLMSAKYPIHTGIAEPLSPRGTAGLPLSDETLADLLKRGGYQTHAIGKWHIGFSRWEFTPTFRGFDSFFGFYGGGEDYYSHKYGNGYDLRHDQRPNCGEGYSQIVDERGNYSTHVFTRQAINLIKNYPRSRSQQQQEKLEQDTKPLFIYLAFQAVHSPHQVPKKYLDQYADSKLEEQRKTYGAMLSAADEGIGNVTDALVDAGLWDDTLVIFTTDNGGPNAACAVQGSSNYPKRGGKSSIWEGGTRGDAFVSGPMLTKLGFPAKSRFPHLFHVVDWMPTLAEMIGIVPRNALELDGKSQLEGLKRNFATRTEVHLGYTRRRFSKGPWYGPAIRHGNWKLLQGTSGGMDHDCFPAGNHDQVPGGLDNSTYLLFDLATDQGEENDLSELYPDMVQTLKYRLKEYQQSYIPPQRNDDDSCPFTGLVNTSMGPTWMPWCKEIVVYS